MPAAGNARGADTLAGTEDMRPRSVMSRLAPWLVGAVILGVYAPVLVELGRDWWRDSNYSHGILIPPIVFFLVWRQRRQLAGLPLRPAWLGLVGIVGAAALLILGAAGAEVFTQRVSFVAMLLSSVLFLLGWRRLRRLWFPIAFLLLAIPLPYVLYYSLTAPMQAFAAKCAVLGLKIIGVPVMAQGNILHLPGDKTLEVVEACSGIRSLYTFLALGALMAYLMPIAFFGRAMVFLATIPLSIAANAFRLWSTAVGAHLIGMHVATGVFHEAFGFVVFVVALALFFLIRKGAQSLWRSAS
ncbi:MAG TPA: exosortase A [Candidatus Krumholzibacteria bacterium]|nr:exosortase A [Candidatus Krumholzibacteria bacterium]